MFGRELAEEFSRRPDVATFHVGNAAPDASERLSEFRLL